RVGTFGVIGLILYFLGMWICLRQANWQMVLLFPILGRSAILVSAGVSTYAKESGLGKSIVDTAKGLHILLGLSATLLVAVLLDLQLVIPVIAAFIIVFLLTKRISKILKGITGDVLGMLVEVSQCVFLLFGVLL
ncbi:MAG: adenosylcobinamide-GDP ribazoletransferase, partial [Vallitaleaceae bacterium]|nr:adenosylcobinamide-GDP ribazoletransferase [Vallitaleaceae bacterium]